MESRRCGLRHKLGQISCLWWWWCWWWWGWVLTFRGLYLLQFCAWPLFLLQYFLLYILTFNVNILKTLWFTLISASFFYVYMLICLHKLPPFESLSFCWNPDGISHSRICGNTKLQEFFQIFLHFPWPSCALRLGLLRSSSWGMTDCS